MSYESPITALFTTGSVEVPITAGHSITSTNAGFIGIGVDSNGISRFISTNSSGYVNVNINSLPLPTGAALDSTLVSLSNKFGSLGQKQMSGSAPVVIASDQSTIGVALSTSLPAGGNTIGNVGQVGLWTVTANAGTGTFTISGTVTANIGTTNGLALDSSVQSINNKLGTLGQKSMSGSTPVVIASDQSQIPVYGTITANIGTTNGLALNATQVNGSQVTQIGNATNIVGIKGSGVSAVTTDPSLVVQISPNQAAIPVNIIPTTDRTISGSITSVQSINISTQGTSTTTVAITGIWIGTINFQATVDGINWIAIEAENIVNLTFSTSTSTNGTFLIQSAGYQQVRVIGNIVSSGTAYIAIDAAVGIQSVNIAGSLPPGVNTIGNVGIVGTPTVSISGGSIAVTQSTASALNATVIGSGNAGTNYTTGVVTIQGSTTGTPIPISGSITATNPSVGQNNLAIPGYSTLIAGSDGIDIRPISVTSTGLLNLNSLPAGANTIGSVVISGTPTVSISGGSIAVTQSTASNLNATVVGSGTAGTNYTTGIMTIQGSSTGTPIPISGSITATNPSVSLINSAYPGSATFIGGTDGTNLRAISVTSAGLVNIAPLPTGSNVIGSVNINGTPSVSVSGTVAATQSGAWTVTANAGTGNFTVVQSTASNLNATIVGSGTAGNPATGVVTIQGISSGTPIPISGSITANNPSVGVTGSAVPADATLIGGTDGTNLRGISVTSAGLVNIAPLPTGSNTIGNVNINGTVAATQSGAWTVTSNIGTAGGLALDTTLTSGSQLTQITNGTNSVAVSNSLVGTEYGLVTRNIPYGTQTVSGSVSISGTVAVTQSGIWAVTSNIGTTGGLALDATLTSGSQLTQITNGTNQAAISNNPAGTEYGLVTRNIPYGTQTVSGSVSITGTPSVSVSGTVAATQSGNWTVTANAGTGNFNIIGTGTAGIPATGVVTVQGISSGTAIPISGTVNQGLPNTNANAWTMQITDTVNGTVAVKPANTAAIVTDPSLVVSASPNSVFDIAYGTIGYLGSYQFWQTTTPDQPNVDPSGQLSTRGNITSDDIGLYDCFPGSIPTNLTGTCNFTNGSTNVSGVGTSFLTQITYFSYVKVSTDSETYYARVLNVISNTQLTLSSPYLGTTGIGQSAVVSNYVTTTGTGTISEGSCVLTLGSGTTNGNVAGVFTSIDYLPVQFTFIINSISQRIVNQNLVVGFQDTQNANPIAQAVIVFSGANSSQVILRNSENSGTYTYNNTVTLPNGLTTASRITFSILVKQTGIYYYANNILLGNAISQAPNFYLNMNAVAYWQNTGIPASSSTVSFDTFIIRDFEEIQVTSTNLDPQLLQAQIQGPTQAGVTSTANPVVIGGIDNSGLTRTAAITPNGLFTFAGYNTLGNAIIPSVNTTNGLNELNVADERTHNGLDEIRVVVAQMLDAENSIVSSLSQGLLGNGTAGNPSTTVVTVQGNAAGVPIPVSGNFTATNPSVGTLGMAAPTSGTFFAGTNGTSLVGVSSTTAGSGASVGVLTVQGNASGTPIPVSGTFTATNPSVGTTNTTVPTSATTIGGTDGTNLRSLATDTNGVLIQETLSFGIATTRIPSSYSGQIVGSIQMNSNALNPFIDSSYTEPTSQGQRSLVSSSVNDTNSTGTGAWSVTITYYDGSLNGPYTETINLNGTTPTNTVGTNIRFIESMIVNTVGTNGINAGIISLYSTTAGGGTVIGTINPGTNRTSWAQHYIANNRTCYITGLCLTLNGDGGQFSAFTILKKSTPTVSNSPIIPITPFFKTHSNATTFSYLNREYTLRVSGPAKILLYVQTDQQTNASIYSSIDYMEI
jgi:hypothetical protein